MEWQKKSILKSSNFRLKDLNQKTVLNISESFFFWISKKTFYLTTPLLLALHVKLPHSIPQMVITLSQDWVLLIHIWLRLYQLSSLCFIYTGTRELPWKISLQVSIELRRSSVLISIDIIREQVDFSSFYLK